MGGPPFMWETVSKTPFRHSRLAILPEETLGQSLLIAPLKPKSAPPGPPDPLHAQGFALRADGERLEICGGTDQGVLFGVYSFLEDHLGCRWLTSEARHIPNSRSVDVPAINDVQSPAFEYREILYRDALDWRFAERNKLNGQGVRGASQPLKESHIGWGTWCHTFAQHIPPGKYLSEHPEYFALVDGSRVGDGQLCLTNPDVFRLVVDDLRSRMADKPEALYWSVSQNDCFRNCQCDACSQIDRQEQSEMGSMLRFVNQIAAEFPDKIISTLAYQYTRKPPRTIKPADNVHIMFCSIECNRSRSLDSDPESAFFRDDVKGWADICDNIFVWDYVIQFANLVSPFPNLHVLGPNLRFFADNSVRGIFSQGNREVGGELAELRAYLLAKLSWNLSYNVEKGIDEFLSGFYGGAAGPIGEYISITHDALRGSDAPLRIFGGPKDARTTYLSEKNMVRYRELFDAAEDAVGDDAELLLRVKTARMPIDYAEMSLGNADADRIRSLAKQFSETAQKTGLEKVEEWRLTVDEFLRKVIAEKLT